MNTNKTNKGNTTMVAFDENDAIKKHFDGLISKSIGRGPSGTTEMYKSLARLGTIPLIRLATQSAEAYRTSTAIITNDVKDALRNELTGLDRVSFKEASMERLISILFIIQERATSSVPTMKGKYEEAYKATLSRLVNASKEAQATMASEARDAKFAGLILESIKRAGYGFAATMEIISGLTDSHIKSELVSKFKRMPTHTIPRAMYMFESEGSAERRTQIMCATLFLMNCGAKYGSIREMERSISIDTDYPDLDATLGPFVPTSTQAIVKAGTYTGINTTRTQVAKAMRDAVERGEEIDEALYDMLLDYEKNLYNLRI
ncbi:MAG: hypothetical protein KGH58_00015 [Candidatus Micrarchaeota archaeon]|nr:hypothetical protein [Candidatus Micrarchaeota archaeon]